MKDFLKEIENRILIYDGSMGYMLQKLGLQGGECGALWNLTNSGAVKEVYAAYKEAGSDVIQANTFLGNRIQLEKFSLEDKIYEINYQGVRLAREVAGDNIFVAASIGPTGLLFEPSGALTFEMAYEAFKEQVIAVTDGGADVINFETFTDLAEIRAALLAAKENSKLPVICSLAYEAGGRTLMGNDPFTAVSVLLSLGADMVGTNCSFGAGHMLDIVKSMHEAGGGFLSAKPNAGLPEVRDGKAYYVETAEGFAEHVSEFARYGARLVGGCCGTTPEYIKALKAGIGKMQAGGVQKRSSGIITSGVRHTAIAAIRPDNTGKLDAASDAELFERLKQEDFTYIEDRALDIASEGFDAVLVNIDSAGEGDTLAKTVNIAQSYIKEPLIIKASDAQALEKALRIYKGIAGVVIEGADEEAGRLEAVARKYGSELITRSAI